MQLLAEMKNNGMSWQEVGKELGVSGTLAWKVCKGVCQSNKIDAALGLAEAEVIVPIAMAKKNYPNPKDKNRFRVALEFDTKEEQQEAIKLLSLLGSTRKEQSRMATKIIKWNIAEP